MTRCVFLVLVQIMEINLSSVVPYVSGPKRPQDRVAVSSIKEDFQRCLDQKVNTTHTNTHTHKQASAHLPDH